MMDRSKNTSTYLRLLQHSVRTHHQLSRSASLPSSLNRTTNNTTQQQTKAKAKAKLAEQLDWTLDTFIALHARNVSGLYWHWQLAPQCKVEWHHLTRKASVAGYTRSNINAMASWLGHLCLTWTTTTSATATAPSKKPPNNINHVFFFTSEIGLTRRLHALRYKPVWSMDHKSTLLTSTSSGRSFPLASFAFPPQAQTQAQKDTNGQTEEWLAWLFVPRSMIYRGNLLRLANVCRLYTVKANKRRSAILARGQRDRRAVFRGTLHSMLQHQNASQMLRARLVALSLARPDLLDARLNGRTVRGHVVAGAEQTDDRLWRLEKMSDSAQMRYRLVVVPDGTSKPDRLVRQLLYGSTVLKETSVAREQWYFELVPFVHFVPFADEVDLRHLLSVSVSVSEKCW